MQARNVIGKSFIKQRKNKKLLELLVKVEGHCEAENKTHFRKCQKLFLPGYK